MERLKLVIERPVRRFKILTMIILFFTIPKLLWETNLNSTGGVDPMPPLELLVRNRLCFSSQLILLNSDVLAIYSRLLPAFKSEVLLVKKLILHSRMYGKLSNKAYKECVNEEKIRACDSGSQAVWSSCLRPDPDGTRKR